MNFKHSVADWMLTNEPVSEKFKPVYRELSLKNESHKRTRLSHAESLETLLMFVRSACLQGECAVRFHGEYVSTSKQQRFASSRKQIQLKYPAETVSGARRFAVVGNVIRNIVATLHDSRVRSFRDLYYTNVALFGRQEEVNRWISVIASQLNCHSRDLGFVPAQKGLVYSCSVIAVDGMRIEPGESVLIPFVTRDTRVSVEKVERIIVYEKEAVYMLAVQKPPKGAILVTAKGYPDFLTRQFLHLVQEQVDLPLECFVDADPYGVDIMLRYRYVNGYAPTASEFECRAQYCGVFLHELINSTLVKQETNQKLLDLSAPDRAKIRSLLNKVTDRDAALHLQRQMFLHKKGEMNT